MFINLFRPLPRSHFYISLIIGIIVFFILSLLPSSLGWLILKIAYFLFFIAYLYYQTQYSHEAEEDKDSEPEFPEVDDGAQSWLHIENDEDVEELFEKFLDYTLSLIKNVLVSDTVILLFANYAKKEFTIRRFLTDKESDFISSKNFELTKGLPSLVLRNRNSLIENHLPAESEILPYYQEGENQSKSFAGVPVFFKQLIVGVLCVDTSAEEAYSNDDLDILKQFGNLITVKLFDSNKLYEYESENWLTHILFDVSKELNEIQTVEDLWNYLPSKVPKIIPCDRISVSIKLNDQQGKLIDIKGGTGNLRKDKVFPLSEGMVGWVMRKNQSLLVEDFSAKENYVPRFDTEETPSKEYLSFLGIPVANKKRIIGTICLESYRPKNFKEQHKRILQTIANQVATLHTTTQTLDKLKLTTFKDELTQLENLTAFKHIISREIKRAVKLSLKCNLLFLKIYFHLKEESEELYKQVLSEFLSLVLPNLRETDYIFRLFQETFAIANIQKNGNGVNEFAEKLMSKLSEKKVWGNGQAFDFYVNIGIVPDNHIGLDIEEIIQKGEESVRQARLNGPNSIAVFQEYEEPKEQEESNNVE